MGSFASCHWGQRCNNCPCHAGSKLDHVEKDALPLSVMLKTAIVNVQLLSFKKETILELCANNSIRVVWPIVATVRPAQPCPGTSLVY